jgi:translation initiation factor eIF-2B subunit epsilon
VFVKEGKFSVQTVVSQRSLSFGDALREIYQSGLVRSDFILVCWANRTIGISLVQVSGDVVADLRLESCIAEHKFEHRISLCYRCNRGLQSSIQGGQKQHHDGNFQGSQAWAPPTKHRVRRYAGLGSREWPAALLSAHPAGQARTVSPGSTVNACLPHFLTPSQRIFQDRPNVSIREDLVETHICICAPEVLSTFADDFDFQEMDDLWRTAMEDDEASRSSPMFASH